jgi:hypothetical protein
MGYGTKSNFDGYIFGNKKSVTPDGTLRFTTLIQAQSPP